MDTLYSVKVTYVIQPVIYNDGSLDVKETCRVYLLVLITVNKELWASRLFSPHKCTTSSC